MSACTGSRLLKWLAAVCFAIAVMVGVTDGVIGAAETQPAQASAISCPHPLDKDGNRLWKPTELDVHRIVARSLGYLVKTYSKTDPGVELQKPYAYLDHVEPAFSDWRSEALNNPERANLCNADLSGEAERCRADRCDLEERRR